MFGGDGSDFEIPDFEEVRKEFQIKDTEKYRKTSSSQIFINNEPIKWIYTRWSHRKPHKDDTLPDNCKEKWYHYETYSCDGCPNTNNCKHKTLKFKTTKLNHEMTKQFLDKRRNIKKLNY